mmetsp:Transcript_56418/g.115443  ORF Transcript_56418/g.115443 Transcript_56418/m.115443 type:complete len:221 (-) Transcript_56418:814-1476(-)
MRIQVLPEHLQSYDLARCEPTPQSIKADVDLAVQNQSRILVEKRFVKASSVHCCSQRNLPWFSLIRVRIKWPFCRHFKCLHGHTCSVVLPSDFNTHIFNSRTLEAWSKAPDAVVAEPFRGVTRNPINFHSRSRILIAEIETLDVDPLRFVHSEGIGIQSCHIWLVVGKFSLQCSGVSKRLAIHVECYIQIPPVPLTHKALNLPFAVPQNLSTVCIPNADV